MTIPGRALHLVFGFLISLQSLAAQQSDADRIRKLEQSLDELMRQAGEIRRELENLKGEPAAQDLMAVEPVATPEAPALTDVRPVDDPVAPAPARGLNPDISAIGTMVGHAGQQNFFEGATLFEPEGEGRAPFDFEEAEIAIQAAIDPYARGHFFIAIGHEGIDLEEGYAQFVALPAGFTAKAGKVKALFGKANTWHTHRRPWVDQPLMIQQFFGTEGLADTGISVSKAIDNPWNLFIEATGEVLSGEVENVFERQASNDLFYNAHLKFFHDITENSNLEVGTSWAQGTLPATEEAEARSGKNRFGGVDVTFRWKPLSRSIYNSFIGRFEALANRRSDSDRTLIGFYASADYQLARRWFAGVRVDHADRPFVFGEGFVDPDRRFTDRGISATLTFWPSEFSQLRGQLRRTSYGDLRAVNELLLQLQFAIGAHGAHTF